jgi:hypothetical protein
MHCPWIFLNGSDCTALCNVDTGATIVLDQTFGLFFWFTSGKSSTCKRIDWSVKTVDASMPPQSLNLLSVLQAGKGTPINSSTTIHGLEWTSEKQGPIIALTSKSWSDEKIHLTVDGFIYSTPSKGGAVVTECTECYTTAEKAQQAIDIAIAEAMKTELRVDSLKVSSSRHDGDHRHSGYSCASNL